MSSASAAGASASHTTTTRLRVPEPVRIVNWPLREAGLRVWLTGLGIVTGSTAAGLIASNPAMGAVCCATLMLASWRLWIPVTFELGTKGVTQSALIFRWRIPWRCFARYETRSHGVWLLNDTEPTPFSTLRGIYVDWLDREPQVMAMVEFFLAARRPSAPISTRTYVS